MLRCAEGPRLLPRQVLGRYQNSPASPRADRAAVAADRQTRPPLKNRATGLPHRRLHRRRREQPRQFDATSTGSLPPARASHRVEPRSGEARVGRTCLWNRSPIPDGSDQRIVGRSRWAGYSDSGMSRSHKLTRLPSARAIRDAFPDRPRHRGPPGSRGSQVRQGCARALRAVGHRHHRASHPRGRAGCGLPSGGRRPSAGDVPATLVAAFPSAVVDPAGITRDPREPETMLNPPFTATWPTPTPAPGPRRCGSPSGW